MKKKIGKAQAVQPAKVLNKARKAFKSGNTHEALDLCNAVLERFPENREAKELRVRCVSEGGGSVQDTNCPHDQQVDLAHLFKAGRFSDLAQRCDDLLNRFPDSFFLHKARGVAHLELNLLEEARQSLLKAHDLEGSDAETLNALGRVSELSEDFKAAATYYRMAVGLDPSSSLALVNLGAALQSDGNPEDAIISYDKALALDPSNVKAAYNKGTALEAVGDKNAAIEVYEGLLTLYGHNEDALCNLLLLRMSLRQFEPSYHRIIEGISLNADSTRLKELLLSLLCQWVPPPHIDDDFSVLQRRIAVNGKKLSTWEELSLSNIRNTFESAGELVAHSRLADFQTRLTELFRYNDVSMNCERQIEIWNNHGVIPERCFACYKVQITVENVVELIRLSRFFDQSFALKPYSRKCFVELRQKIPGFYKGLVYCDSLDVATKLRDCIIRDLSQFLRHEPQVGIKCGCSEYALVLPEFGVISEEGKRSMFYDETWREVEQQFDAKNGRACPEQNASNLGFGLEDFFVMKNWISYAAAIGDESAECLAEFAPDPSFVFDAVKARKFIFAKK